MKKRFIFFIFLLGFLLVPHETFAQSITPSGSSYYGTVCMGTPMNDCGTGASLGSTYISPISSYYILDSAQNVNSIMYYRALKYHEIPIPFELKKGNTYNLKVTYDMGGFVLAPNNSQFRQSTACGTTGISGCAISWSHPSNDPNRYIATMDFLATINLTNTVIGLGNPSANEILFYNSYSSGSQGIKILSVDITETANSIDITPMINEQQKTNNKIDETNNKLDSIGDDLVDDTAPSSQDYNDFIDDLPVVSFGPVSNLLQLPIQILNRINDGVNATCSQVTLPFFYNNTLTLPCFNGSQYFGSNLWTLIGYICAFYIYYQCAMLIVSNWEKWTSFDDGFNSLYEPKHAKGGGK